MSTLIEGNLTAAGKRFAIVVSRFNEFISRKLLEGAMDSLVRHDASADDITVVWVPGAFEIPIVAKRLAENDIYDGVICLGAVIRGNTPHFDYVSAEVTKGVATAGMQTSKPVIFGVVTTDTIEQAIERAGTKSGNKGFDAAVTAIEMVNLFTKI